MNAILTIEEAALKGDVVICNKKQVDFANKEGRFLCKFYEKLG